MESRETDKKTNAGGKEGQGVGAVTGRTKGVLRQGKGKKLTVRQGNG